MRELEHADPSEIERLLARPTPDRLLIAAEALRQGFSVARINAIAGFDPWTVSSSGWRKSSRPRRKCASSGLPSEAGEMRRLKAMGFSDARLAQLARCRSAHIRSGDRAKTVAAGGGGVVHSAIRIDR